MANDMEAKDTSQEENGTEEVAVAKEEPVKNGEKVKECGTRIITDREWTEYRMMKKVLETRQGKALYLDYLDRDLGRYVEMTEEGRRTFGDEQDVWQDY